VLPLPLSQSNLPVVSYSAVLPVKLTKLYKVAYIFEYIGTDSGEPLVYIIKMLNRVRVMVFSTTFNNISVISWLSVLLVKETLIPGENHRPVASH
jgi:hypothetical protein